RLSDRVVLRDWEPALREDEHSEEMRRELKLRAEQRLQLQEWRPRAPIEFSWPQLLSFAMTLCGFEPATSTAGGAGEIDIDIGIDQDDDSITGSEGDSLPVSLSELRLRLRCRARRRRQARRSGPAVRGSGGDEPAESDEQQPPVKAVKVNLRHTPPCSACGLPIVDCQLMALRRPVVNSNLHKLDRTFTSSNLHKLDRTFTSSNLHKLEPSQARSNLHKLEPSQARSNLHKLEPSQARPSQARSNLHKLELHKLDRTFTARTFTSLIEPSQARILTRSKIHKFDRTSQARTFTSSIDTSQARSTLHKPHRTFTARSNLHKLDRNFTKLKPHSTTSRFGSLVIDTDQTDEEEQFMLRFPRILSRDLPGVLALRAPGDGARPEVLAGCGGGGGGQSQVNSSSEAGGPPGASLLCPGCAHRLSHCHGCGMRITSDSWVHRLNSLPFHLSCFTCTACQRQLSQGEECAMLEDKLLCKMHYLETVTGQLWGWGEKDKGGLVEAETRGEGDPRHIRCSGRWLIGSPNWPCGCTQKRVFSATTALAGRSRSGSAPVSRLSSCTSCRRTSTLDHNPDGADLEKIAQRAQLTHARVTQVWFQNAGAQEEDGAHRAANPGAPTSAPRRPDQLDDSSLQSRRRRGRSGGFFAAAA
uniref:LIM zinc-binding domain-containing protein n=1 Tax=Macrostomum lignano TaxID=282301 RepID=A0A1I8JRY1_9PLAT